MTVLCAEPGCTTPKRDGSPGLCSKHYGRWYRALGRSPGGTPEERRARAVERFWPKVDKDGPVPEHRPDLGPCWIWTRALDQGYGRFGFEGRMIRAHRVAYELVVGPIPEGLELDHLCRVRRCVRPEHVEPVTHPENMRRGAAARRAT